MCALLMRTPRCLTFPDIVSLLNHTMHANDTIQVFAYTLLCLDVPTTWGGGDVSSGRHDVRRTCQLDRDVCMDNSSGYVYVSLMHHFYHTGAETKVFLNILL